MYQAGHNISGAEFSSVELAELREVGRAKVRASWPGAASIFCISRIIFTNTLVCGSTYIIILEPCKNGSNGGKHSFVHHGCEWQTNVNGNLVHESVLPLTGTVRSLC